MILSFHGADRTVTGSCHMVESGGHRILVDCGMMQGSRELEEENKAPFGFDPATIDYVFLTHAHLDHCGRIPLLVKAGFRGEIIATAATRELARLVILDAAKLQEEDARRWARQGARRGKPSSVEPLYSLVEALDSLDRFGRIAQYELPLAIAPGLKATFYDASHILGSASILLEVLEAGVTRDVLFSGDIGGADHALLRPAQLPARADFVVMESTYGDRPHRSYQASVEEFYTAVTDTFARGGNVIIPTFALERAQEILYLLGRGIRENRLPPSMQVFLDSPMAISATEIFQRHLDCLDVGVAEFLRGGEDPFGLPGLHLTRDAAESMAINKIAGGAVILAGSGMCTGGRVRHHLRHNLWRREAGIIFVGFAATGTLARRIIDGVERISLFGEDIPVQAHIHTINGFSAHAGQPELISWYRRIGGDPVTFLVHGEEVAMSALASLLEPTKVVMPVPHQSFAF